RPHVPERDIDRRSGKRDNPPGVPVGNRSPVEGTAMSRTRLSGTLFSLVIACWVGGGLHGQEKAAKPDEEIKHLVVPIRSGQGKELAMLVNKQFAGQAEAELLPELNVLVIRAKAAILPDIGKVLLQYDHTPRSVLIEVLVVDLPAQDRPPE